jgi:hypothetical protein
MRRVSMRFQFGPKICPRLKSILSQIAKQGGVRLPGLGDQPWELGIHRIARKDALMDRPQGATNIPTTNTLAMSYRCLKRMPGFEGLWLRYRTSSSETSWIKGDGHRGIQADGGRILPAAGTIVAVRVLDRPARISLRAFSTKRIVSGSPPGPSAFIGD